ncbi:MAG: hypothetical protein HY290_27705 [Planctomycetia bacterium]|nr:hypothetical protein [Planctomycetia bacterium]
MADAYCVSVVREPRKIGVDEIRPIDYSSIILAARNVGVVPYGPDRRVSRLDDQVGQQKNLEHEAPILGGIAGFIHFMKSLISQQY